MFKSQTIPHKHENFVFPSDNNKQKLAMKYWNINNKIITFLLMIIILLSFVSCFHLTVFYGNGFYILIRYGHITIFFYIIHVFVCVFLNWFHFYQISIEKKIFQKNQEYFAIKLTFSHCKPMNYWMTLI